MLFKRRIYFLVKDLWVHIRCICTKQTHLTCFWFLQTKIYWQFLVYWQTIVYRICLWGTSKYISFFIFSRIPQGSTAHIKNSKDPRKIIFFHDVKFYEHIQVCRQAYSLLYAINNKILFSLIYFVAEEKSPSDKLCKHFQRGAPLSAEIESVIDAYIKSLPLQQ